MGVVPPHNAADPCGYLRLPAPAFPQHQVPLRLHPADPRGQRGAVRPKWRQLPGGPDLLLPALRSRPSGRRALPKQPAAVMAPIEGRGRPAMVPTGAHM